MTLFIFHIYPNYKFFRLLDRFLNCQITAFKLLAFSNRRKAPSNNSIILQTIQLFFVIALVQLKILTASNAQLVFSDGRNWRTILLFLLLLEMNELALIYLVRAADVRCWNLSAKNVLSFPVDFATCQLV